MKRDPDWWIRKPQPSGEMCRLIHGIDCQIIGCAGRAPSRQVSYLDELIAELEKKPDAFPIPETIPQELLDALLRDE